MALGITPPDYTTSTGQVRLLAADAYSDPTLGYIVGDDAITGLLSLSSGNVKRGAALVLRAIAADETLVGRVVQTDDLKINGNVTGEQLRKLAEDLEKTAAADDLRAVENDFTVVVTDTIDERPEASDMPYLINLGLFGTPWWVA